MPPILNVNYRKNRRQVFHPAFSPKSPQVERTGQTVSPTGASVAVRPMTTALRRMDSRGTGSVGYF